MRALLLAVSAAALPGLAHAQDEPACARFDEPLAYNACLASHGPKAKDIGTGAAPSAASRSDSEEGAPVEAPKRPRAAPRFAQRHGRVHMVFRFR